MRPWHGWGWLSAWHTPEFFRQGVWWAAWDTTWAHSGYFDLLLGGGVPAAALFAAFVATAARGFDNGSWNESAMRLVIAVFVLAAATQESCFIGSHFLWALLVAVMCGTGRRDQSSVDEEHSGERAPRTT
jgi:O-antigen ligase